MSAGEAGRSALAATRFRRTERRQHRAPMIASSWKTGYPVADSVWSDSHAQQHDKEQLINQPHFATNDRLSLHGGAVMNTLD
ncbi:hypothetical protein [Mesorhizobium shangrilense]|uniref:Uncharacterized protein n=1 Tax=Mesorhizobium shangrilense TaxID=460060 RepID=A0ABV2DSM2_9HYPH